jgi:hypothetical protein
MAEGRAKTIFYGVVEVVKKDGTSGQLKMTAKNIAYSRPNLAEQSIWVRYPQLIELLEYVDEFGYEKVIKELKKLGGKSRPLSR